MYRKNPDRATALKQSFQFALIPVFLSTFISISPIQIAKARSEDLVPVLSGQYAPQSAGAASVTLSGLGNVPIGQNVSFSVSFDNTDATDPGYGPFIDVILDTTGADGLYPGTPAVNTYDGLGTVPASITASFLGSPIPAQDFFVLSFDALGQALHPFALNSSGNRIVVNGTPGDTLIVVRLPFGSFTPDQPPAVVNFTTNMSNLADLGTNLSVQARGGFEFGALTPLNDWCCGDDAAGTLTGWTNGFVVPTLFTLAKTFSGPEAETATGPNYPRTYTVTATIASGQTITNLRLTDVLPDNIQFVSMVTPAAASCPTLPSTTTPGGTLTCNFASATGATSMTFTVYTPRLYDSADPDVGFNDPVVDPSSGDDVNSCNNASITRGTWTPLDTRDVTGVNFTTTPYSPAGCEATHTNKSIAIQKDVTVVSGGDPAPGQTLQYSLTFQISDFFAFDGLVVTDVISDGQQFDPTFTPVLQVNGNGFSLPSASFDPGNYNVDTSEIDLSDGPPLGPEDPLTDGTTTFTFQVSDEVITRAPSLPTGSPAEVAARNLALLGRLLGGCVPLTGSAAPNCSTYNDGDTTATVVFRTVIQDGFTDTYPSGDWSVDQGDVLDNDVSVIGNVLSTLNFSWDGTNVEADDSAASVTLGRDILEKSIYAVYESDGITPVCDPTTLAGTCPVNVRVKPGDRVTYRLKYGLTTSDVENLYFEDYLPLPVFHVDDPDDDGTPSGWTFLTTAGVPAPGEIRLGPDDTFYDYMQTGLAPPPTGLLTANARNPGPTVDPVITADAGNNKLTIAYATYDDTRNSPTTVDLLFTVTVSDDPFADNLYLTNQATAFEGSTNGSPSSAAAIVQIILTEPVLIHKKGVVATDNPNGVFSPVDVGPFVFNAPGTGGARWVGTIDSPGLAAKPIDSNISGVDAGDLVTFAIVIENQGSSAKGAFDIAIRDAMASIYQIPVTPGGLNLRITNGDNSGPNPDGSFNYTDVGPSPGLFGDGIMIVDPDPTHGACQAETIGPGKNIIIITYDLEVKSNVTPGIFENTATLINYAGSDGGPNHVPATPPTDTADTTVVASFAKDLVSTEVNNVNNNNSQVVIGEIVTYKLTSTVPEGTVPNAFITDHLDGGLAFVSCTSVVPSAGVSTDLPGETVDFDSVCGTTNGSVVNPGQDIRFNLGNITNTDRDNGTPETIVITYTAVTLNVVGNQAGTLLNNAAEFLMNSGSDVSLGTASAPDVAVIEPVITVTKQVCDNAIDPCTAVTSLDAGDTLYYRIQLTASTTDAWDVTLSDPLPVPLTSPSIVSVTGAAAGDFEISGTTLQTTVAANVDIASGSSVVIYIQGIVSYAVTPGQPISNTATSHWTSLDGNVFDRSAHNTDSDERTGTGTPAINDYTSNGTASINVDSSSSDKLFILTSAAHTLDTNTPPDVTIGEIIRYRLISPVPEGTSPNFQIVDFLPSGLTFLNDSTARVAFVSDGGIASAAAGAAVPAISGCAVSSIPAFNALPCLLADGNVSSSSDINSNPDTYGTSDDIYFRLGNLTNNDSDSGIGTPGIEYVVIEFNALVDNHSGIGRNVNGDDRDNFSRTFINGAASGPISNIVTVNIVEPDHTLTKTATPPNGDAGDTITYLLTYSNNGTSTAFDVSLTDTVPNKMTIDLDTTGAVPNFSPGSCATGFIDNSVDHNLIVQFTSVPVGCTVTLTYSATLNTTVTAGEVLVNDVDLSYTSLPGDYGTTSNPTGSALNALPVSPPGPYTGNGTSGSPTGERVYTPTTSANVTVNAIVPVKSIVGSSNADTIGNNLTIGEVVTYRLVADIPEGTQFNFRIDDILPAGLTYAGNPKISFIADADMGEDADLSGADLSPDTFPPTFPLPAGHVIVAGQHVTFSLGDIVNNDSDAGAEQVVIEFDVLINNDANNDNTNTKDNFFTVTVNDGAVDIVRTSNTVQARIVEPLLNVAKSANDSTWVYGQTVQYTLDVTHLAASASTAYDIVVTDTIPAGLTFVAAPPLSLPANWTYSYTAPVLTFSCLSSNGCFLPVGSSAQLQFTVTVDSPPAATALTAAGTAVNNVSMVWTSLPGADTNERDGSGTPAVNDYNDTASHTGGLEYYAIGNRVWFDTNNNAAINGAEVGVDGVRVQLFDGTGTTEFPVGPDGILYTADDAPGGMLTSGGGYYLFDYLPAGDYVIVISNSNFTSGNLIGYWSSRTTLGATGALSEVAAPDVDTTATDSDDNGTQTNFLSTREVRSLPITLGPTGNTEPTAETDLNGGSDGAQPDGRANMTADFGFYKTALGNLVWIDDITVDGAYAVGETLVNLAPVSLFSTNGTEIPVGVDGILGTSDDATGGITTNSSGIYAFSGLPSGSYVVHVVGPSGTVSTIDTFNSGDTTTPNNSVDNNDNGVGILSNSVSANTFNMTPGTSGTVTNSNGTTTNNTIDFGFAYAYALGNRIWYDTNNNSQIDFASELGANGVTVQLYAAVGGLPTGAVLATDTTTNGGYYLFDGLFPGDYVVVLPASNFTGAGVLTGYWSSATTRAATGTISETTAALAESNTDSDDNGTRQTAGTFNNAVISSAVTLGPGASSEPTGETFSDVDLAEVGADHQGNQPDGRANMTVDFGFYRVEVGNLTFGDANKNGAYDSGTDTLLSGVTVDLYSADGVTQLGTTITDGSGIYQFSGLPEGDYIIRVTAPSGTVSTIDSFDQADNDNPNTNTDDNDNGDGVLGGTVSSAAVSLTPGATGALGNNTVTNFSGTTSNPTMDFGFTLVYALGNRVWFDTNNNSTIDLGEFGVDGVRVDLYAADGSGNPTGLSLANVNTLNGGYYLFNSLDEGDYVVVLPASNFTGVGLLTGYWSSATTRAADGTISEITAPDADADSSDTDDNGTRQTSGTFDNAVISSAVTLGPTANEPTGETDLDGGQQGQPDSQANMTVDFGFYNIVLGNLVWNDVDDSGLLDGGEVGIQNVDVQLWSGDDLTLLTSTTTNASGIYAFSGLPEGDYIVRIPAAEFNPGGTLRDDISSTGGAGTPYEPAPNADATPTDSDDNGSEVGGILGLGGYIQSSVFALTPGAEQSADNNTGITTENRLDFGVLRVPRADLTVTKDDGVTYYIPGGTLTYTITVSNNGPSDVTDMTVQDARPGQIASWTWVCDSSSPNADPTTYGCSPDASNPATFNDLLDLPLGASVTYKVTATIGSAPAGALTNTVTIAPPTGTNETNPADNSASDMDMLGALDISKDDSVSIVSENAALTYTIIVQNTGAIDLTSITVTDTLPADITFQSASPPPTTNLAGVLTWSGISLTAGSGTTITVNVTVNSSVSVPSITNDVSVMDTNTGANDSDSDTDTLVLGALGKTLVDTDASHTFLPDVAIGEILTYELVLPIQPGTMDNMLVVDTPQTGLAFVDLESVIVSNADTDGASTGDEGIYSSVMTFDSSTRACTNCVDGTTAGASNPYIENSGGKTTFDFGTLTNSGVVNETITIRYTVIVLDIVDNQNGGTLQNRAEWTWTGGIMSASAAPVDIVEPDLSIKKDAQPTVASYGTPITFTLDVAHTLDSTADAFDVIVMDALPTGLDFIPGSISSTGLAPASFSYNPGTATLTFVWDSFPLGSTAVVTFQATFVGPSPVLNTSSLVWTTLPIDSTPGGLPVQLSPYNVRATERWYDPLDALGLDNYIVSASVTITLPPFLPKTGFAPGVTTELPTAPSNFAYARTDLMIEIPSLDVIMNIVGVAYGEDDGWNLTWLNSNAGWLENTAFPTHAGNSAITAHAYLPSGKPGPFVNLSSLKYGDQIIIHLGGQKYIYEVRQERLVRPESVSSVFKHEELPWLTLITCKTYSEATKDYVYRSVVRAVLVDVVSE